MAYKTPGVYVQEISLFPPSVAEVATAIPAFIGYTEKAEYKGVDLTNVPTPIVSLLEFEERFGAGYEVEEVDVVVDPDNNYSVSDVDLSIRYYMYDSLRLFFDNGGGKCYIVSVGPYSTSSGTVVDATKLQAGLDELERYDEPTILLFPDAVLLDASSLYSLQQRALAQCAKLQDRVAVFDLREDDAELTEAVSDFRDNIGINNLKYGAAYTPWLYTTYARSIPFSLFRENVAYIDDTSEPAVTVSIDLSTITTDSELNAMVTAAATAVSDESALNGEVTTLRGSSPTLKDAYASLRNALKAADEADAQEKFKAVVTFARTVALNIAGWGGVISGTNLKSDLDAYAAAQLGGAAQHAIEDLISFEEHTEVLILTEETVATVRTAYAPYTATGWLIKKIDDIPPSTSEFGEVATDGELAVALAAAAELDSIFDAIDGFVSDVTEAAAAQITIAETTLYEHHTIISNIVEHIKLELSKVPPSGAVAGLYAYVDRTRGVWKAPANVSVSSVSGPVTNITDFEQEDLNVDVNAGKSINAIRAFTGRGTVVWGARTLAGNDSEWRYVPVRRFFNMVEESVKKSTGWAVFEPNNATLWTKVKGMIANYLITKWREGALAGATPDEAFFVHIGLGETMTAQDVLDGFLIIEIGMAVVRPAEFIILKFSHKMQES